MQCMMGFYKQNMQNVQSVQNMQQNIPAQMANPAIWLQYFCAVATSQAASRETIQNYIDKVTPSCPLEVPGFMAMGNHGIAFGPFPSPWMGEGFGFSLPGLQAMGWPWGRN